MTDEHGAREYLAWLDGLAPGDEVAIVSPGICVRIERIDVVHPDGRTVSVRCGDVRVYRRADGERVGVAIAEHIEPVSRAHRDEIERHDLVRWLRSLPGAEPTLEELRAMRAAFDEVRARSIEPKQRLDWARDVRERIDACSVFRGTA